jgi:hypothetical protein
MPDGFWQSLTPQSVALATWVTAVAAIIAAAASVALLRGLWLTKQSMEESKRTAVFQMMHERFNGPAMRFARAAFAWIRLNPEKGVQQTNHWRITLFGWEVLDFLCSVAQLVDERKIEFHDAEMAFARHILSICGDEHWKQSLESDDLKPRYAPLLKLFTRIKESGRFVNPTDELKAGLYDEPFWHCEMRLADRKEVEASVMEIRERRKEHISSHNG